jgi:hypothetical protein
MGITVIIPIYYYTLSVNQRVSGSSPEGELKINHLEVASGDFFVFCQQFANKSEILRERAVYLIKVR